MPHERWRETAKSIGLVAHRRGGRSGRARRRPSPSRPPSRRDRRQAEPLGDHLVGAVRARGCPAPPSSPKRPSTIGEMQHRQRRPSPAGARTSARCRSGGSPRRRGSCAPAPGAQLLELLAHARRRRPSASTSGWRAEISTKRASLERLGVGREHRQGAAVGRAQVELDAVDAAEHELLAGQRDLVPDPAPAAPPGARRSPARRR